VKNQEEQGRGQIQKGSKKWDILFPFTQRWPVYFKSDLPWIARQWGILYCLYILCR